MFLAPSDKEQKRVVIDLSRNTTKLIPDRWTMMNYYTAQDEQQTTLKNRHVLWNILISFILVSFISMILAFGAHYVKKTKMNQQSI